jgi:chromosome partitioning protein
MDAQLNDNSLNIFITPKDLASALKITVQGLHKFLKDNEIKTQVANARSHRITPATAREIILKKGLEYPKIRMNLHNLKGGVGKTTSVHTLATRAAAYGFKVLAIDLDQQANLTSSFGVVPDPRNQLTIEALFNNSRSNAASEVIIRLHDHLDLIPSNLSMANFDTKLTLDSTFNVTTALEEALQDVGNDYDLVIIDSPPALSKVTTMAHLYSDMVLIPIESEKFSLDGLEIIFGHLSVLKKKHRPEIATRIFINKYDNKPKIDYYIASEVAKNYGDFLCESVIPLTSGLKTSIAEGEVVWASSKRHNALPAFDNLFKEILNLEELWGRSVKKPTASRPMETHPNVQV